MQWRNARSWVSLRGASRSQATTVRLGWLAKTLAKLCIRSFCRLFAASLSRSCLSVVGAPFFSAPKFGLLYHHGARKDEDREEGVAGDDREVLLSHDPGLPDQQEDCGGGGHYSIQAAAQQDCGVRDSLDEAYPARSRARDLAEAAGGGARAADGLRAGGVRDQDGRDRGGPRDHRAVGAPEHAPASGRGAAGGPGCWRVLQAARRVPGGQLPGQQEQELDLRQGSRQFAPCMVGFRCIMEDVASN